MLILGRKSGESIKIGDDITLHVVKISNGQVSIGIDAPANVIIERDNFKKSKGNK